MPPKAYLIMEGQAASKATAINKKTGEKMKVARLGFVPWEFKGLGGKPGE